MQYLFDPKEMERVSAARESFSGRMLTNHQYHDIVAIVGILKREILKGGAFKEKLGDFSYAFARTEKMDIGRTEIILRDHFKEITGQTMNQLREELLANEEKLVERRTDQQRQAIYDRALAAGDMIEKGDKISLHRAFAHHGEELGRELGITDAAAKRLMKEEFKAAEGSELYDWLKDREDRFFRPQIEAEKQRAEERTQRERGRSADRSRNDRDDVRGGRSEERRARDDGRRNQRDDDDRNSSGRARSRVGPRL